jgi:hypothetical protein
MPIDLSYLDAKPPVEVVTEGNLTKILLTNSNMSMFQECHWKYWVRQLKYLVPLKKGAALNFGSAYHDGIEHYYKGLQAKALPMNVLDDDVLADTQQFIDLGLATGKFEEDDAIPTKVKAMVKGFIRYFRGSVYRIDELETPFLVKMDEAPDFEIDGHRYEFWLSGQMDALMHHTGTNLPYIGEWKTCTQFADFISKAKVDNQPWHYMLCRYLVTGKNPNGVIYRIARKTLIRQKKDETAGDYYSRIVEQYSTLEKDHYHEEIIYWEPRRIDRHIEYLNMMALEIRNAFVQELWHRNKGSCFKYNNACSYMSLCNTYSAGDFQALADINFAVEKPNSEIVEPVDE